MDIPTVTVDCRLSNVILTFTRSRKGAALSDGHLLGHGSLARRATGTEARGSTRLLLKHFPELQALIGSYRW